MELFLNQSMQVTFPLTNSSGSFSACIQLLATAKAEYQTLGYHIFFGWPPQKALKVPLHSASKHH